MKLFVLLITLSFAAKQDTNFAESGENFGENVNNGERKDILVKIEEDEYAKVNKKEHSSQFIGVSYNVKSSKWHARRHSKLEKKVICNGSYDNEETAAHASDTLVRKLLANGEQAHKLNFPFDESEIYPEKEINSSQYIGVCYDINNKKWHAQRRSRREKKTIYNGSYKNQDTAAHASDTLARKLMKNGEQSHKLNFPKDDTEVYSEKKKEPSSQYIGVMYDVSKAKWRARRQSKLDKKLLYNGSYDNEETAAHASDTLARKLMTNDEQSHKLNFPDDDTEVFPQRARKRKRPHHEDVDHSKNN